MMKRILTGLLALSLLLTAFTGCGKKDKQSGAGFSGDAKYAVSKNPVELSIFLMGAKPFDENLEVFREAGKLTNVSLKGYLHKNVTDAGQAFNLMMASGDLADIICHTKKQDFFKFGSEGALLPLNDLIEEHAPNIKKVLEEHPDWKKYITTLDGNIYYIPFIADGEVSQVWYMRQDWLDKLGLERPKTTEEFYTVLKAFREQDPNGNGEKDEIPLFSTGGIYSFYTAYPLWGAIGGEFLGEDGKIQYGPAQTEFKNAMLDLAKWYKEGLIDQEIFTRGGTAMSTLLTENKGGCTHAWVASTAKYNDILKDSIEGFSWVPIAPPGQKSSHKRQDVSDKGWAISSKTKDPVAVIKYFDFWFTEEGRRLMNFGIEGVHYDMVDGKPTFKAELLNSNETIGTHLGKVGAQSAIGFWQDFAYEEQTLLEVAREGIREYVENDYCLDNGPYFLRTDEETREYSEINSVISSYVEECSQKWIMGQGDPEKEFDGFVQKLKDLKLDRMLEIQQAAYERYMNIE